jgi:hypothetical protein
MSARSFCPIKGWLTSRRYNENKEALRQSIPEIGASVRWKGMADWISTVGHFIEADVIRWTEGVFRPRRRKNVKAPKLGDRVVTAEVLREDTEWVYLLVRQCELASVKTGRLPRQVPLLHAGDEIKRKRRTLVKGAPERLPWSDENVRSVLASKFLGARADS